MKTEPTIETILRAVWWGGIVALIGLGCMALVASRGTAPILNGDIPVCVWDQINQKCEEV